MACLMNYTIQCRDVISGETGCFFFDQKHWQKTGEFSAIGDVFKDLDSFYHGTTQEQRKSIYIEKL